MKYFGFIREHNFIKEAVPFKVLRDSNIDFDDPETFDKVIEYLYNGQLVIAFMGRFQDIETKEYADFDSYLTDGEWVWPSYYPYYIKNHKTLFIEPEFYQHIIDNNFKRKDVTKSKIIEIYDELKKFLNLRIDNG